jgi:hypothetical protein
LVAEVNEEKVHQLAVDVVVFAHTGHPAEAA